jgi:hypothetical protein
MICESSDFGMTPPFPISNPQSTGDQRRFAKRKGRGDEDEFAVQAIVQPRHQAQAGDDA